MLPTQWFLDTAVWLRLQWRESEKTLVGNTLPKILRNGVLIAIPSAVLVRPALAAIKLGGAHLSQLAESSRSFESAALVLFGVGFLTIASAVRRWQSSSNQSI